MQAGFAYMNSLTVIQASQGLAAYLAEFGPSIFAPRSILIGYDARYNSAMYARLAANAFRVKNFKVLLFEVSK